MTVHNPQNVPVAFKVKTTAPRQYCVRPNSARLEPGERVEVQVLLQPMKEDPPEDAKCKDKFLVQSAAITGELEALTITDIWSALEGRKQDIKEQKIRCAYLPPLDANGYTPPSGATVNGTETDKGMSDNENIPPPGYDSNRSRLSTTSRNNESSFDDAVTSPRQSLAPTNTDSSPQGQQTKPLAQIAKEVGTKPIADSAREASSSIAVQGAAAGAAIAGAASVAANKASSAISSTSNKDLSQATASTSSSTSNAQVSTLQRQLADAQKEITRLQSQLKSHEARSGGPQDSSMAFAQQLHSASGEGVPVNVVALISLGVFIFTWLFF